MDSREIGVHKGHCCVKHGCKYGDPNCPVVKQVVEQSNICEECSDEGIQNVFELIRFEDIDKIKEVFNNHDSLTSQNNKELLNKILKLINQEYGYK